MVLHHLTMGSCGYKEPSVRSKVDESVYVGAAPPDLGLCYNKEPSVKCKVDGDV